MNQKRILLAGGNGFLGRLLAKTFHANDYEVGVLTRAPAGRVGVRELEWDGRHIGEWIAFLDGAEAVVNLTGKNINCPHTPENLRELAESRVNSVNAIAAALEHIQVQPRAWVQAGAIGFYGDPGEAVCDENSPAGSDALAKICEPWEDAFVAVRSPKTRKILLRIGFVLGRTGGALPVLEKLTKRFLGGRAGNGRQFISWVHHADLTRMFLDGVEREKMTGIFNATAPNPVTNGEFMRELRRALHRPWSPPTPAWAVKIGARLMNSEPSLALSGCRVVPRRLMNAGFRFKFPELREALADLYGRGKVPLKL